MISLDKKLFTARSTIFRQAAAGITALVYEDTLGCLASIVLVVNWLWNRR